MNYYFATKGLLKALEKLHQEKQELEVEKEEEKLKFMNNMKLLEAAIDENNESIELNEESYIQQIEDFKCQVNISSNYSEVFD